MRIAIISPWAVSPTAVGGTERYVTDLAEGLTRQGNGVTVYTLSGSNHAQGDVTYKSLDLLGNGNTATEYDLQKTLGSFVDEASFDKLAQFVEARVDKNNFDIFHINSLLFLKAWPKKRRLFTIHTNPYEYRLDWGHKGYQQMVRLMRNAAVRPGTTLTAPSQHYASFFAAEFDVPVTYLPHAIDSARLVTTISSGALHKKYSLHPNKTTLLLPSRLEPTQKRPQIAFKALAQLPTHLRDNLQVVAAGLDTHYVSFRDELQQVADEAGFKAHFLKFDYMAEAYAIANIVGLPSCSESFGYAALESLSIGKPTILNDIPPYREIGTGNPNAYFFNGAATSFAKALVEVLSVAAKSYSVPTEWLAPYQIDHWISSYVTAMHA